MTDPKTDHSGLNSLAQRIHDITVEKGFWDADRNFGEMIALAHSELSEALEEHRAGRLSIYYSGGPWSAYPEQGIVRDGDGCPRAHFQGSEIAMKAEGTAAELADCIIRCLDTMHSLNIDIDQVVADKIAYNANRPHRHGKAY